jgi:hypothetical protein
MGRSQIYYYTLVPVGFDDTASILGGPAKAWLPGPAMPEGAGWQIDLMAHGALPAAVAARRAWVTVGATRPEDPTEAGTLWRSVLWRAAASDQLFPVMEADLELAKLDDGWCQLSFMGSYRPPLAVVGGTGDRLFGRRVAEACTRQFVLDIAGRLSSLDVTV